MKARRIMATPCVSGLKSSFSPGSEGAAFGAPSAARNPESEARNRHAATTERPFSAAINKPPKNIPRTIAP